MNELPPHIHEGAEFPGWLWPVLVGLAAGALGFLVRTIITMAGGAYYTKEQVDDRLSRLVTREDWKGTCGSHNVTCERRILDLRAEIHEHAELPTHRGTEQRVSRIEAKTDGLEERLARIESKLDRLIEKEASA